MGVLCESGLVMAVVTMVTVGGRCGKTEPGKVGVAAALSTRGRVLVVRTGVTVKVCTHKHTWNNFSPTLNDDCILPLNGASQCKGQVSKWSLFKLFLHKYSPEF